MPQSLLSRHGCPADSHLVSPPLCGHSTKQAFAVLVRVPISKWNFSGESLQVKKAGLCLNDFGRRGSDPVLRSLYIDRQEPNFSNIHDGSNGPLLFKFETTDPYSQSTSYVFPGKHAGDSSLFSGSLRLSEEVEYSPTLSEEPLKEVPDINSTSGNVDEDGCICTLDDVTLKGDQLYAIKYNSSSSQQISNEDSICLSNNTGWVYEGRHCYNPEMHAIQQSSFSNCNSILVSDLPGIATNSGSNKQLGLRYSLSEVPKPVTASGWLSLGVCGNALITRIGRDGRCFYQPGEMRFDFQCKELREGTRALGSSSTPVMLKACKGLLTEQVGAENIIETVTLKPAFALKSSTTKSHQTEKLRRKSMPRQRKPGKAATQTRDLFGRSSFQLFEVIICYPFMNSNLAVSNFQCLSRENLEELVGIFNQIAVVLAGSGLALVLFVASRMLSVNAAFDSGKVTSVVCGLGLIWLSSAIKKLAEVVRCMADTFTRAKSPRKEHLTKLRRELQGLAFKAFTLIVLCLVRFG